MPRIIALDEMGNFEERNKGVRFVGGYYGDVDDDQRKAREIEVRLKQFCDVFNEKYLAQKDYKTVYPRSLHGSGSPFFREVADESGRRFVELGQEERLQCRADAKKFSQELENSVVELIKEENFKLYAFIDPYMNREYREDGTRSNILDSSVGANLYERMAILAIYNQLFYTLETDVDEYCLELATRTLSGNETWSELYEFYENSAGGVRSKVTNLSTYKTAVSTMLYEKRTEKHFADATYRFHVKSINYGGEGESTPFHYLADIACGVIRRAFQEQFGIGKDTQENLIATDGLKKVAKRAGGIQIRIYDEAEAFYRQMVECFRKKELAKGFALQYELENCGSIYRDFYVDYWLPKLNAYLAELLKNDEKFRDDVYRRVPEYLTYTDGFMGPREVVYEKGLYIASRLAKRVEAWNDYGGRNLSLFRLYDIMLRGYNHRGSVEDTKKYIAKCEQYKMSVGVEEYVSHTIRVIVFYFNNLDYEAALGAGQALEDTVLSLKLVYVNCFNVSEEISRRIVQAPDSGNDTVLVIAGKLFSSIGQAYGFQRRFWEGRRYFFRALQEFKRNSEDYSITLSHFLQLLISEGHREEYETYAAVYFEDIELWGQMEHAFTAMQGDFGILIFVKAFRKFYAQDAGNEHILKELLKRVELRKKDSHPWELIYKNLYECVWEMRNILDIQAYEHLRERTMTCVRRPDFTIRMIQLGAKFQFMLLDGQTMGQQAATELLDEQELKLCAAVWGDVDQMTADELWSRMQNRISYEYR